MVKFPARLAMFPNAALFGAKMVTSRRPLTVESKLVAFKAPYSEVRRAVKSVVLTLVGIVRTRLMT